MCPCLIFYLIIFLHQIMFSSHSFIACNPCVPGRCQPKRDLTYFWQDKDGIINAQTELTFELVNEIINTDTPSTDAPTQARKAALYLLDQVCHDTRLDGSPIVANFLDGRMKQVLSDLKQPLKKGSEGVQTL